MFNVRNWRLIICIPTGFVRWWQVTSYEMANVCLSTWFQAWRQIEVFHELEMAGPFCILDTNVRHKKPQIKTTLFMLLISTSLLFYLFCFKKTWFCCFNYLYTAFFISLTCLQLNLSKFNLLNLYTLKLIPFFNVCSILGYI